jgi:hypothetical protein
MKKIAIILSLAIILTACGDTTDKTGTENSTENKREPSPAEKLSVLDNIYDTSDIKAIRIKTLVSELATKYAEPADTIAEYTYRAQSVLHDKGIAETCLGVLEEMHKVNKIENTPYKDAVTMYLLIRSNQ